ncbi:MAG: hypothetical protein AAFX59_07110 [Pseudomonadota bacterium]
MKPIELRIVSNDGIEATISTDGSRGDEEAYYSIVSVKGLINGKKILGGDPFQSFCLGLQVIEKITEDRRIGKAGDDPMPGITWSIIANELP